MKSLESASELNIFLQTTMPDSDEEVNLLMSTDIIVAQLVTKDVEFNRSQSGWIFREDKRETVGQFHADVYAVQGINLETKKRREHLTEEDLAKNKEPVLETLTKTNPDSRLCDEVSFYKSQKHYGIFLNNQFYSCMNEHLF